jgi:hypothetical protein
MRAVKGSLGHSLYWSLPLKGDVENRKYLVGHAQWETDLAHPQGRSENGDVLCGHKTPGNGSCEGRMSAKERRTYDEQIKAKTDVQE